MTDKLNWGILGPGSIARTFAKGVARSKTGQLVAVGSRTQANADKFGAEFNVPSRYGSYEALLADKNVQAVYVATPHPLHARWAIAAAQAGKHILCEKPIGLNFGEAMSIIEAARANDVFLMEAFMYRCHPQIAKVIELIRGKAIGDVKVIHATFSFHWPKPFNAESRLTKNDLGGGGILDVGCYPVSMSRLIAGVAMGKDFENPIDVRALGHLESTGIDGYAIACLKFPGDILAQCSTGVQVNQENVVRIFGTDGSIVIPDPWIPGREGGAVKIIVTRAGKAAEEIAIESGPLYALEADTVAANISRRQAPSPAMSWDDTLGNMKTLDNWRRQIGLVFESEQLSKQTQTHSHKPLKVSFNNNMKYGRIPGIDKPVSRIACGADFSGRLQMDAMPIFDHFYEHGGNFFDTSWHYGGPDPQNSDTTLGAWVRGRGLRDKVVVLGKGGHTPFCNPKDVRQQILKTLEQSGLGYLDIYMLHRDNLDIPVGEFVDLLNEEKKAGRIRAFGGSNWSIPRIEEANEYARKKGIEGFTAVSNNFSLAVMVDAPWEGCLHNSDPASIAWFKKTQMIQVPWSSQARGFFVPGRAHPDRAKDDPFLARVWFSPDNFKRLERATELAKKKNVMPITIALAYVLSQEFPTYALIGPRQINETRESLAALNIELTPQEVKWLSLGA